MKATLIMNALVVVIGVLCQGCGEPANLYHDGQSWVSRDTGLRYNWFTKPFNKGEDLASAGWVGGKPPQAAANSQAYAAQTAPTSQSPDAVRQYEIALREYEVARAHYQAISTTNSVYTFAGRGALGLLGSLATGAGASSAQQDMEDARQKMLAARYRAYGY